MTADRRPRTETKRERRARPRGPLRLPADLLYRTLRFIARHVQGFFGAVAAFLTIDLVIGAAAAFVFVAFGHVVMQGATQTFDEWVLRQVARYREPWLDRAMLEITTLGNTFVLLVTVGIASIFLWLTRHHYSVYLLLIAVIGQNFLNSLLKDFYERPRPSVIVSLADVSSESFPSGHAMSATVAYASVAYLVSRLEPAPTLRRTTWALAAILVLAIGASRVYLGVHYPSDVLAGFLAGLAWLAVVIAGLTAIRFFAMRRRPEVEQVELGLYAEEERATGLRR